MLFFGGRLLDEFGYKREIPVTKLLCPMTERTEVRRWIECVNKCGTDEAFVRCEILELAVHQREQFFFERCFS